MNKIELQKQLTSYVNSLLGEEWIKAYVRAIYGKRYYINISPTIFEEFANYTYTGTVEEFVSTLLDRLADQEITPATIQEHVTPWAGEIIGRGWIKKYRQKILQQATSKKIYYEDMVKILCEVYCVVIGSVSSEILQLDLSDYSLDDLRAWLQLRIDTVYNYSRKKSTFVPTLTDIAIHDDLRYAKS